MLNFDPPGREYVQQLELLPMVKLVPSRASRPMGLLFKLRLALLWWGPSLKLHPREDILFRKDAETWHQIP